MGETEAGFSSGNWLQGEKGYKANSYQWGQWCLEIEEAASTPELDEKGLGTAWGSLTLLTGATCGPASAGEWVVL